MLSTLKAPNKMSTAHRELSPIDDATKRVLAQLDFSIIEEEKNSKDEVDKDIFTSKVVASSRSHYQPNRYKLKQMKSLDKVLEWIMDLKLKCYPRVFKEF